MARRARRNRDARNELALVRAQLAEVTEERNKLRRAVRVALSENTRLGEIRRALKEELQLLRPDIAKVEIV